MLYIISALTWLSISIILHTLLNKFSLFLGISRSKILVVFVIGLVGCIFTTIWLLHQNLELISLPFTSIVLFCSCSFAYAGLTASPTLGDQSPTTKILLLLLHKGPQSEKQMLALFSGDEVLGKRIHDLIESHCIQKRGNGYVVTIQGERLANILAAYRRLLGLSDGG